MGRISPLIVYHVTKSVRNRVKGQKYKIWTFLALNWSLKSEKIYFSKPGLLKTQKIKRVDHKFKSVAKEQPQISFLNLKLKSQLYWSASEVFKTSLNNTNSITFSHRKSIVTWSYFCFSASEALKRPKRLKFWILCLKVGLKKLGIGSDLDGKSVL